TETNADRRASKTEPVREATPELSDDFEDEDDDGFEDVDEDDNDEFEDIDDEEEDVDGDDDAENEDDDDEDLPVIERQLDPEVAAFIQPVTTLFDKEIISHPEKFLVPDVTLSNTLLDAAKWMFDLAKHSEPFEMSPLAELLTDGFDLDQIWEQMQLRNRPMVKYVTATASDVISRDQQGEGDEDVFDSEEEGDDNEETSSTPFGRGRRTELDDEFFSLHEMEKFAERGEERDMRVADGKDDPNDEWNLGLGYLNMDPDELEGSDDDDELNANEIRYEDYFLPPRTDVGSKKSAPKKERKLKFNDQIDERAFRKDEPASNAAANFENDDEDENEEAPRKVTKSRDLFDLDDDEDDNKSWTLKGEVSGKVRPMNSLLEEDLEIEHASRPTPVITEETTKSLEDLIKSRIAENLYDDVQRKIAPKEKTFDPNRRNIIDEQKSSKSLTDLYEQDYRKQSGEKVKTAKDEAVEKAHQEIDELFKDLCMNLDALSNWHFTAKAPVAELEVVAAPSVPALSIEEVIPSVVSDAVLAAPKEVYAGQVGKSEAEMEKQDKVRARKKQKRIFKKQKVEREMAQKAAGIMASGNQGDCYGSLMKQKNVTIGSAAGVAALKSQGGKKGKAVKASVLQQGGTIGKKEAKGKQTAQMLML
ncbi:Mpp10 protein, partial [Rhizoclosmatium globosum]